MRNKKWTQKDDKLLIELYTGYRTIKHIAERLGRSYPSTYQHLIILIKNGDIERRD